VLDAKSGKVTSYLLTKDLIAHTATDQWQTLLRPLQSIGPDDDIESTLSRMQRDGVTILLVEDDSRTLGLITLEDILEQVVGRIEDEYPHEPSISLEEALITGGVKLDLASSTRDEAIFELADFISDDCLPEGWTPAQIAERAIAREAEYSTDLRMGVAIPHVRCPGLRAPLVVAGRSELGVIFSSEAATPPKLIFLLVTPTEIPESHLALLQQIADVVSNDIRREELLRAASPEQFAQLMVGA
jgi:mannitol/fructose-specific phosphotransferase system IIA component (Ntr-type)